ncbi:MAG: shikimate kinase [Anaerolineales bacterium]|nr:shikimate kinase [Anaerolineales bacterium]
MRLFPHKRIVVVGTTASGKSTLAEALAKKIGADFIELDALHWEANWVEAPDEVFLERVDKATQAERWVVAGNYSKVRNLIWLRAELVVWLDYPLPLIFWRLLARTIRRAVMQEELWNGNREKFWWHLKLWSEESLFHWLFKTYWRRKREYSSMLADPQYARIKSLRFKSPRDAQIWLERLP